MESLRSFSSRLLIGGNDDDDFEHEPEEKEYQSVIQVKEPLTNNVMDQIYQQLKANSLQIIYFEILNINYEQIDIFTKFLDQFDITYPYNTYNFQKSTFDDPNLPTRLKLLNEEYCATIVINSEFPETPLLIGGNDDDDFEHEPEEKEKQWAIQRCMESSEYDEENTIIMWIKKIKQSEHKQHERLMVITNGRLFTARRGGSKKKPKFEVRREAHILALTSRQEAGLILHIHFRDFEVSFECNDDNLTQKILGQLYRNYTFYNPGFPQGQLSCKWLDQYKADQEADLRKKYPVIGDSLAPWERPARAFKSWAYFCKEANKDKLSLGLKSIVRRPLDDMVVDDERWLHTKSLEELEINENPIDPYADVPPQYICMKCKEIGQHWIMQCEKEKKEKQSEELNLSYNNMIQQHGLILSRKLASTGTCAALGLAGCGFAGQSIAGLASLLSNQSLQCYARWNVSDNNIGCEAAIMFASIFVLKDRIMSLKLNNCDLTHEGMGYIVMSLLTQPRLKLLEMDFNCKRSQWNSGKYHVNDMLRKLLEKCLNLESLSIKNDPERGYQVDLDQFLHVLKTNDSLISLDISGNSMTNDNLAALKDVVIRNQGLGELHWDQNNITSKHIMGLTHALKQNKALQLVEFPDKDFQRELDREKSSAKKMELQMIKKNATTQEFQQSTTNYKRTAAKRGSFMAHRPKNEVYKSQVGGNALGLPQFGGNGPNAGPPRGSRAALPPNTLRLLFAQMQMLNIQMQQSASSARDTLFIPVELEVELPEIDGAPTRRRKMLLSDIMNYYFFNF